MKPGQIAEGVARLRGEMINLQVLREERRRERERQVMIIREELGRLASTLDGDDRGEILSDLNAAVADGRDDGSDDGGGRQLGVLAFVMGRLSGAHSRSAGTPARAHRRSQRGVAHQAGIRCHSTGTGDRQAHAAVGAAAPAFPNARMLRLPASSFLRRRWGGDFYDYFVLDDGCIGVVIADVSGKGVPAAFFMAICRTLLKMSARFVDSPGEALTRVNNLLAAENEEVMFVTLFYGVLEPASGRFVYASAGHNPPALRSGGEVRLLRPARWYGACCHARIRHFPKDT